MAETLGQRTVETPWHARARDLEATEGPYCCYAAFCEWLRDHPYFDEDMESNTVDLFIIVNDAIAATLLPEGENA